jgi:hypothetical protein
MNMYGVRGLNPCTVAESALWARKLTFVVIDLGQDVVHVCWKVQCTSNRSLAMKLLLLLLIILQSICEVAIAAPVPKGRSQRHVTLTNNDDDGDDEIIEDVLEDLWETLILYKAIPN